MSTGTTTTRVAAGVTAAYLRDLTRGLEPIARPEPGHAASRHLERARGDEGRRHGRRPGLPARSHGRPRSPR